MAKKSRRTKLYAWQERAKAGDGVCASPGCAETRTLTVDHIVPASLIEQFEGERGDTVYNLEENFQFLCRYHNYQKANRLDVRNPRTYEVLDLLIKRSKEANEIP